MEQSEINQIVLAAVNAVGSQGEDRDEWMVSIQEMAARVAAMCAPSSSIVKVIQGVLNSKVFTGVVLSIEKEESSTRGLITLQTRPSKFHEDGIESVRTERTDTPLGLAMARRIRRLVGHRVVLWVEVEIIRDGASKTRVVRHIEDLGVVESDDEETVAVSA
ncbi:MAG: hypothetical protein ACYDEP_02520 [Acidimicrobiales bacterium]